jgi:hypothetical protein
MPLLTMPIGPGGAILGAYTGCSVQRLEALKKADQKAPDLVPVIALVDTGASCTAIGEQVMQALQIPPSGETTIQTPSTGQQPHKTMQYDVAIYVPGAAKDQAFLTIVPALPVISADFKLQGFDVLIGRDILNRGALIYNGHAQTYSLAF